MRVFVTGATGWVGSAVVTELLNGGHDVLALARSEAAAAALEAAGADVHRGALEDLDSLRRGAVATDGVIHTAFNNVSETTDFAASARADLRAIEAIGEALEGSDKPFVSTSGTMVAASGRLATEEDPGPDGAPRVASENATTSLAERGVRGTVVRLAPSVHGEGDNAGFVPTLIRIARNKGVSAFVDDGSNRWPAVHRLDAARLYRLAMEAAPAGSRLHGAHEVGVPFRDIAETIGYRLKLPAVSIPRDEADGHFGFLARFASTDNPTSSSQTRELLGWQPAHIGLLEDLEHGHYFLV